MGKCQCIILLLAVPTIMQVAVLRFPTDVLYQIVTFAVLLVAFAIFILKVGDHIFDSLPTERHRYRIVGDLIDGSVVHRVVMDPISDEGYIISGPPHITFREACLSQWPFERIPTKSDWIIRDERSNDVSDKPLSDVDGITFIEAYITSTPIQMSEERDKEDRYSTPGSAVEYYD